MRRLAALAGIVGLQLLSCGGNDSGCTTGDCHVPTFTVVKWMFDHYPEVGFQNDSCVDFGVGKVHVDLVDPTGAVMPSQIKCASSVGSDMMPTQGYCEDSCDNAQVTFADLPPGTYTASVTPLDAAGNPLVTAPATAMVDAGSSNTTVYVPWTSWVGTYTGTFLFRLTWGGKTCAMAMPPVVTQVLKLVVGGAVVTMKTDTGHKLDGTDPEPCRPLEEQFPQTVKDVPFGFGKLTAIGLDGSGSAAFHQDVDVFVGAGISNPTVTYDVPADAGIDAAPPDAAPDAAVADAAPGD